MTFRHHTRRLDGHAATDRLRLASRALRARLALRLHRAQVDRLAGANPGDTFALEQGESVPEDRRQAILRVLGLT